MLLDQDGGILLLIIIMVVWLSGLILFVYWLIARYRNLTNVAKNEELSKDGDMHFQKIGLVRYNPFSETGGDQSFALAILNKNGDGFVISSLHSRDNTRVYAKPVEKGKPTSYDFSKEEKEAINKASK